MPYEYSRCGAEAILALDKRISHPVHCFIEIDTGYGRTGVKPEDDQSIESMHWAIADSKHISFAGFLTRRSRLRGPECKTHSRGSETTRNSMVALGNRYRKRYPHVVLSIGDTPTCSLAEDFTKFRKSGQVTWCSMTFNRCTSGRVVGIISPLPRHVRWWLCIATGRK